MMILLETELSAVEASLAAIRPKESSALKEQVKSTVLLEAARLVETEGVPLSREKLIETIVKSGEPEITLSLQEYVKTVRQSYTTQGILIGLVAGFLIGVFGTVWLTSAVRPVQMVVPMEQFNK
jgi:hypothetical protein